ncbi:mannose-6-phosphate isomerase [Penicillium capsulatum]|uniref:Mannose-6-phosphate isomerase n=1 Tax=Penicillium capsulatum TaxID=69766 RepID=A0A9W9HV47_9EURO|nr:mannose-6-phosphate isomerase [Penicillium capsulatum]KAJ6107079.1 mannose-6-phosphate isomerase [Penicillium capsulatum]
MNFMTLAPGHTVCVPLYSIYAWLSGDILEYMERSDNVLNTGFCSLLTFTPYDGEATLLPARPSLIGINEKTVEYTPIFRESNVLATNLGAKDLETHADFQAPSILVVTEGSGTIKILGDGRTLNLGAGCVFFAGPEAKLQSATDDGRERHT